MSRDPIQPHSVPDGNMHMPFGALVPMEMLFWQPEGFPELLDYRNKYIFLWPNIRLNFIPTGQDNFYLSLKNCTFL